MTENRLSWNEETLLQNAAARPAMAKVGAGLALVVEQVLAPTMQRASVRSCLHILDEINKRGVLPVGGHVDAGRHQPLICPMHPERLICNMPKCIETHYRLEHPDEHETAKCFVCEAPMADPLTGELCEFEGVIAQVMLHEQVRFFDDSRERGYWFSYSGDLWTLPVAYLCLRHSGLIELPIRMGWPMGVSV